MQKNKNLIRNIGIVLLNIFMVVSLVLVLMLISRWSVRGLNVDRKESIVIHNLLMIQQ